VFASELAGKPPGHARVAEVVDDPAVDIEG
jgi:hypothetical protein